MTRPSRPARQTLRQIFTAPLVIGVLSTVGLISALVGDGVWDGLSWLTLAIPCLLFVGFIAWPRGRRA
ncbi:MAG: hypothetical protein ACOY4O_17860 [Pseudomonadota bacterium]